MVSARDLHIVVHVPFVSGEGGVIGATAVVAFDSRVWLSPILASKGNLRIPLRGVKLSWDLSMPISLLFSEPVEGILQGKRRSCCDDQNIVPCLAERYC